MKRFLSILLTLIVLLAVFSFTSCKKDEEGTNEETSTETEETQNAYVGKVVLSCTNCKAEIYKLEEEVVLDSETKLANTSEKCSECEKTVGFEVLGKLENFEQKVEEPENLQKVETKENPDWKQFGESFKYMGLGMLGVFIVTAIIILCITALNRIRFFKQK